MHARRWRWQAREALKQVGAMQPADVQEQLHPHAARAEEIKGHLVSAVVGSRLALSRLVPCFFFFYMCKF